LPNIYGADLTFSHLRQTPNICPSWWTELAGDLVVTGTILPFEGDVVTFYDCYQSGIY
jgi:hypothetical protein